MKTITLEELKRLDACDQGVELFERVFGNIAKIDTSHPGYQAGILMYAPFALGWLWIEGLLPMWSMAGWQLENMPLRRADLRRADLRRANLRWANLQRADLQRANLQRADLRRANLQGADLRRANLHWAKYDKCTILPDSVDASVMMFCEE